MLLLLPPLSPTVTRTSKGTMEEDFRHKQLLICLIFSFCKNPPLSGQMFKKKCSFTFPNFLAAIF
jgi:hypothetical protein